MRLLIRLIVLSGCLYGLNSYASPNDASLAKTEQEVLRLFLQSNLSLIASRMQIDVAEAQLLATRQLSNPDVSLNVAGLGAVEGYSGGYWQQPFDNVLRVEQLIETANKRSLRITSAQLAMDIQSLQFKDLLRSLTRDVKQLYYQVVLAQRHVVIYNDILVQLSEIQSANELRWKSGDISETEFRRSELEVLKAKTDVEQARLKKDMYRQQLAELLSHGVDWQTIDVVAEFPKHELPSLSPQAWLAKALDQRADLEATAVLIAQQDREVALAQALQTPDIKAALQYQHNSSAIVPDSVGVGVSVSVPLWHHYEGQIAVARANKRAADVAWQQLSVQIKTQVSLALSSFLQKRQILSRFDEVMLSRAKQVKASSVLAYRQGAISLLELLDAEKNYRNVLLDYDQALFDQTSAWLDLMYAVGEEGAL